MSDTARQREEWIPPETFGGRLLLIRSALRVTVEEAAARCNLKTATWSTWERGARPRDMVNAVDAISRNLGVNRDWLMWGRSRNGDRSTAYVQGDLFPQVSDQPRYLALAQ